MAGMKDEILDLINKNIHNNNATWNYIIMLYKYYVSTPNHILAVLYLIEIWSTEIN